MSVLDIFDLTGKTVLITGGGGLLGAHFAVSLAEVGANVAIADLRGDLCQKKAKEITAKTHKKVLSIEADITQKASAEDMVFQVVNEWGKLDILLNCAQYTNIEGYFDSFEDYSSEVWQKVVAGDIGGMFLACQAGGKQMLKQGGGSIVNLSSIYGVNGPDFRIYGDSGIPSPAVYSVTKAGVVGLSKYLATYWANKNIRVNVLVPGGVQTTQDPDFVERYANRVPLGRMAQKSDLVGAVLYLVSDASQYVTGHCLAVDGGWMVW